MFTALASLANWRARFQSAITQLERDLLGQNERFLKIAAHSPLPPTVEVGNE
jgi:hypothetical protein